MPHGTRGERGGKGGERVSQRLPAGIGLNQPKCGKVREDEARETRELVLAPTPP